MCAVCLRNGRFKCSLSNSSLDDWALLLQNGRMRSFGRYLWKCIRIAFTHSFTTLERISTIVGLLFPVLMWANPDWFPWAESQVKELAWQIPVGVVTATLAVRALMAPYWAYQELLNAKNESEANYKKQIEKTQKPKPALKLELKSFQNKEYYAMGPKIGQTEVRCDGLTITVTNTGPTVSLSKIDLFITKQDGTVHVVPPAMPCILLPQPLVETATFGQNYKFPPFGLANILSMRPRLVVVTSCGYKKTLGETAFHKMNTVDGYPLLERPVKEDIEAPE